MQNMRHMVLFVAAAFSPLVSQQLTDSSAENFIQQLIFSSQEIRRRIAPAELIFAERLGIEYKNVLQKIFIGNDFSDSIKSLLQTKRVRYLFSLQRKNSIHSMLTVTLPLLSQQQKFYFKNNECISSVSYLTDEWGKRESKYLSYRISDSTVFNSYSMKKLDEFVERVMDILKFTVQEKLLLENKKILYVRCKNEEEIEQITGFRSLGMALLSHDAVITQFNCHYHELAHILINYKLKNLPLYTHPFFQEGFAVAVGGRGGKEPNVILNLGEFIAAAEFESHTSLLRRNDFAAVDPSISYALSGLYNLFLLEEFGGENYLHAYLKFSNSSPDSIPAIPEKMLPAREQWNLFLKSYSKQKPVSVKSKTKKGKVIWSKGDESVSENSREYIFTLRDTMTILSKEKRPKYVVSATAEEIRIYNVFSMNTIANFVSSFSFPAESVPWKDGLFTFSVRKNAFDEPLSESLSFIVE